MVLLLEIVGVLEVFFADDVIADVDAVGFVSADLLHNGSWCSRSIIYPLTAHLRSYRVFFRLSNSLTDFLNVNLS